MAGGKTRRDVRNRKPMQGPSKPSAPKGRRAQKRSGGTKTATAPKKGMTTSKRPKARPASKPAPKKTASKATTSSKRPPAKTAAKKKGGFMSKIKASLKKGAARRKADGMTAQQRAYKQREDR